MIVYPFGPNTAPYIAVNVHDLTDKELAGFLKRSLSDREREVLGAELKRRMGFRENAGDK